MTKQYLDAELCGHDYPEEGDSIHVAGDPVDMICLASPLEDAKRSTYAYPCSTAPEYRDEGSR